MNGNTVVETLIGAVVIAVAAAFAWYTATATGSGAVQGYELVAKFSRADGVTVGADVRVSGIKVGTVTSMDLDQKTYFATVHIAVRPDVLIPEDSSVRVTSDGLLGNAFLSIEPGGSPENLQAGAEIANTQGSIDLVSLIGRAVFGATGGAGETQQSNPPAPQP